jgi:Zn-dependent protease with chaperone function
MFANFINIIIVLLIYATYQPPEATNFAPLETVLIFISLIILFAYFNWMQFHKLKQQISSDSFLRLDHKFNLVLTRQSVMAIVLFVINIYVLNLPYFFTYTPVISKMPTIQALIFLTLFICYLSIVWAFAHESYQRLYSTTFSRKTYIWSNISFSVPILLPWVFLSGIADIIQALPFRIPKIFLSTPEGQVLYFLVFLFAVALIAPAMIQKFWRCKPLEEGTLRRRIETLCRKAGLEYANILYWPIFGGRMITAGVMGLIKKFRYILVTKALFHHLDSSEIDAVIAHEIGHVKKKHLMYYMVFFAGFMLINYATYHLLLYAVIFIEPIFLFITHFGFDQATLNSAVFGLIFIFSFLIYFRYIFGYFMRNFERQADCYVYTLFDSAQPLVSTMEKIALTSGQPPDKPNWHHYSISERIAYLKKCEKDRGLIVRHDRKIQKSIAAYFIGMLLIGGVGYSLNFSEFGKRLELHIAEKIFMRDITISEKNLQRNCDEQIEANEKYLTIDPDNPIILNNLAWFYVKCDDQRHHDPSKALVLAKKAAELLQEPFILDTLAESYYVNGMFEEALTAGTQALQLATIGRSYYEQQLKKFISASEKAGN